MMFGISRIQYSDLKVQLEDLKKENEKLAYANKVYKERLESEMANASFAVDWKTMNVFSIERMWENGVPKTILGYILEEPVVYTEGDDQRVTHKDVVREWTLYCSAEKHEQLVKEFIEYKGKKK
jgi:hypothetical protein